MYIGSIPQYKPNTIPAMNLATYSMTTLTAKVVKVHAITRSTENISIVNLLPNESANIPAGKVPIIAPIGISAAIVSPSLLLCSVNGAELFEEDRIGRLGDVHARILPLASAPMDAGKEFLKFQLIT